MSTWKWPHRHLYPAVWLWGQVNVNWDPSPAAHVGGTWDKLLTLSLDCFPGGIFQWGQAFSLVTVENRRKVPSWSVSFWVRSSPLQSTLGRSSSQTPQSHYPQEAFSWELGFGHDFLWVARVLRGHELLRLPEIRSRMTFQGKEVSGALNAKLQWVEHLHLLFHKGTSLLDSCYLCIVTVS